VRERGIVVAGGLHPAIREKYFCVGHMGDCSLCQKELCGALAA